LQLDVLLSNSRVHVPGFFLKPLR